MFRTPPGGGGALRLTWVKVKSKGGQPDLDVNSLACSENMLLPRDIVSSHCPDQPISHQAFPEAHKKIIERLLFPYSPLLLKFFLKHI